LKENGVEYNEDYCGRKIYIALSGRKWYGRFINPKAMPLGQGISDLRSLILIEKKQEVREVKKIRR
jgi:hypothetical protein